MLPLFASSRNHSMATHELADDAPTSSYGKPAAGFFHLMALSASIQQLSAVPIDPASTAATAVWGISDAFAIGRSPAPDAVQLGAV